MVPRGAQRQAIMLSREWQKAGHHVQIFTAERAEPYAFDDILADLPRIHTTGPWSIDIRRGGTLPGSNIVRVRFTRQKIAELARHLESEAFDVVHAHNHPAQWIAGATRLPTVWTCNEPPVWHYYPSLRNRVTNPFAQLHDRRSSARLRGIAVLDQRMKEIVEKGYPGIPVHLVGSGCELPGPLPIRGAATSEPRLDPSRFHVLSVVGGLTPQKRPLDAVRAVAASGVSNATLHLVGADVGDLREPLHSLAKRLGVDLRWHPHISESYLLHLYANADAGLFIPENQPWGIFPLEMLLAGLPVVLSAEVGALEILPRDYPFVTPVGDTDTAGRHLLAIHADPKGTADAVAPARAVISRDYNWAACARRTLSILEAAAVN